MSINFVDQANAANLCHQLYRVTACTYNYCLIPDTNSRNLYRLTYTRKCNFFLVHVSCNETQILQELAAKNFMQDLYKKLVQVDRHEKREQCLICFLTQVFHVQVSCNKKSIHELASKPDARTFARFLPKFCERVSSALTCLHLYR